MLVKHTVTSMYNIYSVYFLPSQNYVKLNNSNVYKVLITSAILTMQFECIMCGKCCRFGTFYSIKKGGIFSKTGVCLEKGEIMKFKGYIQHIKKNFFNGWWLKINDKEYCILLDKDYKCLVHNDKPFVCKKYTCTNPKPKEIMKEHIEWLSTLDMTLEDYNNMKHRFDMTESDYVEFNKNLDIRMDRNNAKLQN